jgi:hypothetical protein
VDTVTVEGIPVSTFLAFVVTGAGIVIAIVWALIDRSRGD